MDGLKEMLLQEQSRLEDIFQKTKERLKDVPQGTLRVSFNKKWVQYYHCMPGGRKNGTYISKTQENLIRGLAQKSYDEKIIKLARKRILQIQRIAEDYEDEEMEQIFLKENREKQKLI